MKKLILCMFTSTLVLVGQDFELQVEGGGPGFIIPVDTNFRMIYLDDLEMSSSDPSPIFNLAFEFQDSLPYAIEYEILAFIHGTYQDNSRDDTLSFETINLSQGDSLWIELMEINTHSVLGIRYLNFPGDAFSGFSLALASDSSFYTSDYLRFLVRADTMSNWLNFMPMAIGNVWKHSGPYPIYTSKRQEIIETLSIESRTQFTLARERQFQAGYGEGIIFDTLQVYSEANDPYSYYMAETGAYYVNFLPQVENDPNSYAGLFPQSDGTVRYGSQWLGGSEQWTYGIGYSQSFEDGFGVVSQLIGYRLNGLTVGDIDYLVGVDDNLETRPNRFRINTFPNPFNAALTISYSLSSHSPGTVSIYDLNGTQVYSHIVSLAEQQIQWTPKEDIASGIYIVRLESDRHINSVKTLLLK